MADTPNTQIQVTPQQSNNDVVVMAVGLVAFAFGALWWIYNSPDSTAFEMLSRAALAITLLFAAWFYVSSVARAWKGKLGQPALWVTSGYCLFLGIILLAVADVMLGGGLIGPRLTKLVDIAWWVDHLFYMLLAASFLAIDSFIIWKIDRKDMVEREFFWLVDIPTLAGFSLISALGYVASLRLDQKLFELSIYFVSGAHIFQLIASNATFIVLIMLYRSRTKGLAT